MASSNAISLVHMGIQRAGVSPFNCVAVGLSSTHQSSFIYISVSETGVISQSIIMALVLHGRVCWQA